MVIAGDLPLHSPPSVLRAFIVALAVCVVAAATVSAQSAAAVSSAVATFEARRYAEAESAFHERLRRDSADAEAMHYLGRLALRRGDDATAARWLRRAIGVDGRVAEYHRWLGRAYAQEALHAGFLRRARLAGRIRDAFTRAVDLDPRHVDARMDLLRFHLTAPGIAGGSVRVAQAQARALEELDPVAGGIARGLIAEKERDAARAEREYLAMFRAQGDSPAAYYALGAMYQRAGRAADAFAIYERLMAAHPSETEVLYQIGRTASNSGQQLEEGANALRRYLEVPTVEGTPLPSSAHYRLGLILERQGKRVEALRELERAQRLEPERNDVKEALARLR